jgi:hypothetical protein
MNQADYFENDGDLKKHLVYFRVDRIRALIGE